MARPRGESVAQATLHVLTQNPAVADAWRSLAARARVEEHRLRLEALPPEARLIQVRPLQRPAARRPGSRVSCLAAGRPRAA